MTRAPLPARIALLAVAYALVGRLGLMMEPVAGFATLVWPPSGVALAALVLYGRKLWPGVALGAFAVNLWVGAAPLVALGIATGNTLEALLGAWALARFARFIPSLERLRDVMGLVACACVTTVVAATAGAATLMAGGVVNHARFPEVWQTWWVGDTLGELLIAPLLLTWGLKRELDRPPRTREGLVLVATLLALCAFIFGPWSPSELEWLRRVNFLIPVLMWSAIRFGPRGATAAAFACSVMTLWGTVAGYGPFVRLGTLRDAIIGVQLYLPLIAASFLALGAVTAERAELLRREREARQEAERAVAARDEFLAVAAHELATPLTPLQLELENLNRAVDASPLAANLSKRIDRAARQTSRLAKLTERLLDVSRLAGGSLTLEPTEFDFSGMVREVVDEFRPEALRAGSELTLEAASPVVGTWDQLRSSQVVSNLLSNAVKYGGGKPIHVEVRREDGNVVLEVEDHGAGIDPAALPRIFERFERGSPQKRRGGLGLGLFVTREIARAHGGRVEARSEVGKGSTFTLSLPMSAGIDPGNSRR